MPLVCANDIEIEYESYGDPRAPAMLLVMGLGAQLLLWPMPFVDALVARGWRVIRYDNRDVGLSTKFDGAGTPNLPLTLMKRMFGLSPRVPYTLTDMAGDAEGLLDALDIERAHIVGASMGGMIAQLFAASRPARTLSLASIMSTTGNPRLARATREAMAVLLKRPDVTDLDALVAHGIMAAQVIGSPAYPTDRAELEARVRENIARSHYPPGFARHMAAIIADGDRRTRLAAVTAPTVIIHGTADPLVPVDGGRDTARHIAGAEMVEINGMGHNLPPELIDRVATAIDRNARRGDTQSGWIQAAAAS